MPEPPTEAMVRRIRLQAEACSELGSPLYEFLLQRIADDVETGGPAREVLRGHEDDAGPAGLALRLMGGVHRLVLERRLPELAVHYPSVGGDGDAAAAWPVLRGVLGGHRESLRPLLDQAPQTNEVGRASALLGGLAFLLAWRDAPVRLVELGASAGLNLRVDRFRLQRADGTFLGPPESPVELRDAWAGTPPPTGPSLQVVDRFGCDTAPVDPTTAAGRLLLTSYVWADQRERLERLRGAFEVAAEVPAEVERAGAASFVRRLELVPGTTTVIWHSVMWQYLDAAERRSVDDTVEALGASTDGSTALARISLEPTRRTPSSEHEFLVAMRTWPGGERRVLGHAHPHGVPTTWE